MPAYAPPFWSPRAAGAPLLFDFLSSIFSLLSKKPPDGGFLRLFQSFSSPGSTGETRFLTLDITIDVLVDETPLTLFRSSRSLSRDFVVSVQTFRRKSLLPVTTWHSITSGWFAANSSLNFRSGKRVFSYPHCPAFSFLRKLYRIFLRYNWF